MRAKMRTLESLHRVSSLMHPPVCQSVLRNLRAPPRTGRQLLRRPSLWSSPRLVCLLLGKPLFPITRLFERWRLLFCDSGVGPLFVFAAGGSPFYFSARSIYHRLLPIDLPRVSEEWIPL